ncbi:phage tail tape measure protein [Vibrio rotiferianus]|nr:phage tail tape measure protein [Vibrio rotiferianus]TMX64560.1 phage tail tape measure protein [Vibrio rotiferianus]
MNEKLEMVLGLVDQVTAPLRGISNEITGAMDTAKSGMQDMVTGGAGLVATGFAIQNALMPAIEMDRKLGEVKSLGVLDEDLAKLSRTALYTSVQYGKSATDMVGAAYDIKSAFGSIDGDSLADITKSSAVLAAATKADTATITDYMGTMYGVFKNSADEMGLGEWSKQVAGMTAQSVEMFKTTGAGMSSAFTSVGANATSAGVAMEEQMAILGTLQSTMSGSEAGTKYKSFLAGVGGAQDKLNLSFVDAQGKMLPMLDILDKLKGKFGDTLDVAESDALKTAFGSEEAVSLIKLLMADTQGLASSMEVLGNVKGMSKAEQMASAMTDQWERLEAAWFAVRAAVFGAILPSINAVVGSIADGIVYITAWTDEFPLLAELMGYGAIAAISLGGVVASLSMVMGIAKMMSGGWAVTMAGLNSVLKLLRIQAIAATASAWLFNAALWANPITWVVAGVVALIAAVGAMIYWWDEIKASFADTTWFNIIAAAIDGVIDMLNMIPGVNIEWRAGELPDVPQPDVEASPAPVDVGDSAMTPPEVERSSALNVVTQETVNEPASYVADYAQADNVYPFYPQAAPSKFVPYSAPLTQVNSVTEAENAPNIQSHADKEQAFQAPYPMPETVEAQSNVVWLNPQVQGEEEPSKRYQHVERYFSDLPELPTQALQLTPEVAGNIPTQHNVVSLEPEFAKKTGMQVPELESEQQAAIEYKRPENTPSLPKSMVKNMSTTQTQSTHNVRQFGDVYITPINALTPDELAEWEELNVG